MTKSQANYMKNTIKIRVSPNAGRNEIVETMTDGIIKIKLKAPPVDGKANTELIKFLSKEWKIPKTNITITKGQTSKNKTIIIEG